MRAEIQTMPTDREKQAEGGRTAEGYRGGENDGGLGGREHLSLSAVGSQMAARASSRILVYLHSSSADVSDMSLGFLCKCHLIRRRLLLGI